MVSNLLGYAHYLDKLPKDQLLEATEDNKQLILNTNKFWKFAKDESKVVSFWKSLTFYAGNIMVR